MCKTERRKHVTAVLSTRAKTLLNKLGAYMSLGGFDGELTVTGLTAFLLRYTSDPVALPHGVEVTADTDPRILELAKSIAHADDGEWLTVSDTLPDGDCVDLPRLSAHCLSVRSMGDGHIMAHLSRSNDEHALTDATLVAHATRVSSVSELIDMCREHGAVGEDVEEFCRSVFENLSPVHMFFGGMSDELHATA